MTRQKGSSPATVVAGGRHVTYSATDLPLLRVRVVAGAQIDPGEVRRDAVDGADPKDPALIERALAAARAIPGDRERGPVLAAIAERLAGADPKDPALIERALAAAGTILDDRERSEAFARVHAMTRSSMLDELSRWRLRSLGASIDLLDVFLGHSHDKPIAESIGLAVLDVAVEFSAEA